jgi:cytochrome c553
MQKSTRFCATVGVVVLLGATALSYMLVGAAEPSGEKTKTAAPPVEFTGAGKLKLPVGYRKWVYLGTPLTPNDLNGGEAAFPEFHNVYIDPDSFAHFEKTGEFRDGTVLVKDLVGVGATMAASGKGYFQGEFNGLDVAIKDSHRFADEPGNWAYFNFGHKPPLKAEAAKSAVASCNSCHESNATKDWVFIQYYPVLRAALPQSK